VHGGAIICTWRVGTWTLQDASRCHSRLLRYSSVASCGAGRLSQAHWCGWLAFWTELGVVQESVRGGHRMLLGNAGWRRLWRVLFDIILVLLK
jgi:hypothetical protein